MAKVLVTLTVMDSCLQVLPGARKFLRCWQHIPPGGLSEVMGTVPVISQPQQLSPPLQHSNIVNEQEQDSTLCRIRYYIERCRKPSKKEQAKESKSVQRLLKHHDKLVICDGVLYKLKRDSKLNKKLYLFVVPASLKAQVLRGIHDAAGHQGRSRSLSLARQ